MRFLVSLLRPYKQLRRPLTALHYALWRSTGVSGVTMLRPELRTLTRIVQGSPADHLLRLENGQRILIFSFRGWKTHTFPDALLGHALRLRGADVHLFTCGGRLPICDITSHLLAPPMPCNVCAPFVTGVADALRFPKYQTKDFITSAERAEIIRQVSALPIEALETFEMDDLPIGMLVRPSLQWFLLTGTPSQDAESTTAYRKFLVSGAVEALVTGRLLDTVKPSKLYLLNGIFFAERIAIEQARRRGITFMTHEGGFMPNTHVYLRNGFAPYHDLSEFWPRYAERPLTPRENDLLDAFLRERTAGRTDVTRYYPSMEADTARITEELRLDSSKPIFTVFTNVDWDTAAFAPLAAFPNMEAWVTHLVQRFAARPNHQLVIRIHPAEVRLPSYLAPREPLAAMLERRFDVLPDNVRVVPPESGISSYALMELSTIGLVYTSTVGMEMSLMGRPVVVGGQAYYANRGFTLDARTPAEYDALIDSALHAGPLSADQVELARRYAFLFFFRYHLPFNALKATWDTVDFTIESLDELRPGREPYLDLLCDAVLHDRPFLYEGPF